MRHFKGCVCTFLVLILLFSCLPISALAAVIGDNQITSAGAFVMDFETGLELYEHQGDVGRVPASMTKLLAAYVVYDAVKNGEINLDTEVVISKNISAFSNNREYSNIPLAEGSRVTVDRLLDFVLVYSACAATDALGEAICGSVDAFIARMNEKTAQLGIDALFFDSYGGSPDNRISPRGVAVLVRNLIFDHPEILIKTNIASVTYGNKTYENTNRLLATYEGIDGLKTGYTGAAGYCFAGTAARNGRRVIIVTMGSQSAQTRFPDAEVLLDYGFSVLENAVADYTANKILPASSVITVNGTAVMLTVYNINDYHYFKLRDIAFLLNDTEKQFETQYDGDTNAVLLTSNTPYTAVGDELDIAPGDTYHDYAATSSTIMLDGTKCDFEVYNIDDYNYFRLRDIAALIDFGVDWDDETHTVLIDTSKSYAGEDGNSGATPDDDYGSEDVPGEDDGSADAASEDNGSEGVAGEDDDSNDVTGEDDGAADTTGDTGDIEMPDEINVPIDSDETGDSGEPAENNGDTDDSGEETTKEPPLEIPLSAA